MNKNIVLNPSVLTYNGLVRKDFKINIKIDLGELNDVSTEGVVDNDVIVYNEKTMTWEAGPVPTGSLPDNIVYYGDDISLLNNDVGYIAPGDNISILLNDAGYIDETEVPVDGITVIYNTGGKIEAVPGPFGFYSTIEVSTSSYTATFDYQYYGVTYTGGICTVTLPLGDVSSEGKLLAIADEVGGVSWGSRGILVQGQGGQLINGETSVMMKLDRMSLTFLFRNNTWKTI